jgi:transcriptional regulator with XRE-family HTH domain
MAEQSRGELGDFLRSRRERLSPEAAGLPNRRRRRTPGLRREEVAELAGIGVDWYIRLEQGRAVSPSTTTIDALARALRLADIEHAHLRALARSAGHRAFVRETVPEAIRRLVASFEQPAYVTGRRWDILAWNGAAADVFTDFARMEEDDRNILVYMLTDSAARRLFGSTWADEARRMVAQFRVTHDLWADDPAFVALLDRLRRNCPEFTNWWEAHDVRGVAAGRKWLDHPERGLLGFEYAAFQAHDDSRLKLVIYSPVPTELRGDAPPARSLAPAD